MSGNGLPRSCFLVTPFIESSKLDEPTTSSDVVISIKGEIGGWVEIKRSDEDIAKDRIELSIRVSASPNATKNPVGEKFNLLFIISEKNGRIITPVGKANLQFTLRSAKNEGVCPKLDIVYN